MHDREALDVLNTEEALHPKLTRAQFWWLTVCTVVFPVIVIAAVGTAMS